MKNFGSVLRTLTKGIALCFLLQVVDSQALPTPRPASPTPAYSYDNGQVYGPWKGGKDLGSVSFPLSETVSNDVKDLFIMGLKLLHAFEYPEARSAFQQARQQHQGDEFIMGLWGELMCNYQILWFSREFDIADHLLTLLTQARENHTGTLNISERVLLDGATKLFSNENNSRLKQPFETGSNVQLFAQYLNDQLSQNEPLEAEVEIFSHLARLATRQSVLDYDLERGVIGNLSRLLAKPELANHPGLHHYLVHASESPRLSKELQTDAYDSALWLQQLSSDTKNTSSVHLTHMPTHFYFASGDWLNVHTINLLAWNKSLQRATDLAMDDSSLAFHEHLWRLYGLLQAGRYEDAWTDGQNLYERIQTLSDKGVSDEKTRVMRTYYAFEQAYLKFELPNGNSHLAELTTQTLSSNLMSPWGKIAYYFTQAWDALDVGNDQRFTKAKSDLNALQTDITIELSPMEEGAIPVMIKQLEAQYQRTQGNLDEAIRLAISAEQPYRTMRWDHGVPLVVKPLLEYIGELYMEKAEAAPTYSPGIVNSRSIKKPTTVTIVNHNLDSKAMTYFQDELNEFFPRRRKSLEGLLSAAKQAGNKATYDKTASVIATLDQTLSYPPPAPDSGFISTASIFITAALLFLASVM